MSGPLKFIKRDPLFALALLVLCTGLVAALDGRMRLSQARAELVAKSGWTRELAAIAREARNLDARQDLLARMTAAPITPLEELLQTSVEEFPVKEIRNLPTPVAEGWILHRRELLFENVALPALMRFVKSAERSETPWRLESIQFFASSAKPGYARASLTVAAASMVQ